jgi:hypothetical protein
MYNPRDFEIDLGHEVDMNDKELVAALMISKQEYDNKNKYNYY